MKTVELQTKCGKIQGIDGENCFEFRGIKYANAKRWEYPQVIEKWQGVFDATCFKECSCRSEAKTWSLGAGSRRAASSQSSIAIE